MKKDNLVYLRHILDAISVINEYTMDIKSKEFLNNRLVQDGVIRQIQIIGEATKRLSRSFRTKHTQVPWKDIAGMRDKLVHDYMGVNIDAVWNTVEKDIPQLKKEIEKLMHL